MEWTRRKVKRLASFAGSSDAKPSDAETRHRRPQLFATCEFRLKFCAGRRRQYNDYSSQSAYLLRNRYPCRVALSPLCGRIGLRTWSTALWQCSYVSQLGRLGSGILRDWTLLEYAILGALLFINSPSQFMSQSAGNTRVCIPVTHVTQEIDTY